jgi:hypothetical protein
VSHSSTISFVVSARDAAAALVKLVFAWPSGIGTSAARTASLVAMRDGLPDQRQSSCRTLLCAIKIRRWQWKNASEALSFRLIQASFHATQCQK